jgi:SlyX protein
MILALSLTPFTGNSQVMALAPGWYCEKNNSLPFIGEDYYNFCWGTRPDRPLTPHIAEKTQRAASAMSDDITARVQILEEKFAHQERLVDALNEVIIEQQRQIGRTEEHLQQVLAMLEAASDQLPGSQEPPPPHY